VLFGIASSHALPALLFSNVAAMTLIGFNAHEVANGLSTCGAKQRTAASAYTLMDPQTLAHAICKISAPALQDLFNGTIQALAAFGVFMAEVTLAPALRRSRKCRCGGGGRDAHGDRTDLPRLWQAARHRAPAQPAGRAGRDR
jgi:hypothetical protein